MNECKRQLYFSQRDLDPVTIDLDLVMLRAKQQADDRLHTSRAGLYYKKQYYSRDTCTRSWRGKSPFLDLAPPSPSVTTQPISDLEDGENLRRSSQGVQASLRVHDGRKEFVIS